MQARILIDFIYWHVLPMEIGLVTLSEISAFLWYDFMNEIMILSTFDAKV